MAFSSIPGPSPALSRAEHLRDQFGFITEAELAALLGVDERTVAAWRARRSGPDFATIGRLTYYRRADVAEWIDMNVTLTDRTAS
jgi:predicted DNA-binding transcriptional regulator AlpA